MLTDPREILIAIYAAWDTYRAGHLSLEEFTAEMKRHEHSIPDELELWWENEMGTEP
jgi:hypothetical protein